MRIELLIYLYKAYTILCNGKKHFAKKRTIIIDYLESHLTPR